jgi:signal peptidase
MPGPGENDDSDAGEPRSSEDKSIEDESAPPASSPDRSGDTSAPDFTDEESPDRHTDEESSDGHTDEEYPRSGRTGTPRRETAGPHDAEGKSHARDTERESRALDQSANERVSPDQSMSGPRAGQRNRQTEPVTPASDEDETSDWVLVSRDVVITVVAVALIGGYLFAVSGVWPPMVAIESGSMEPNMNVNDMVFVMDNDRFEPAAAQGGTGVVTAHSGEAVGYTQYGKSGDVIIFEPGGDDDATPIIHRAMFWVEGGENWYDRANESYVGAADSCAELSACPAPHAGFITKGDANSGYDQASLGGSDGPVKPDWIVGTAELRVPKLGWFRLQL